MGQLQGFGPIRRSRGGPGFKAAFAPGTERNLFTAAALGALGRQFLGADSPIATFAQESAQGKLQALAEQESRDRQLKLLMELGLLSNPNLQAGGQSNVFQSFTPNQQLQGGNFQRFRQGGASSSAPVASQIPRIFSPN